MTWNDEEYVEEGVVFEWDRAKANANLTKHGVSFREAATAFFDTAARIYGDPDHSEDEQRFLLIGLSATSRELIVVAVERAPRIRLISARKLTLAERRNYEDES